MFASASRWASFDFSAPHVAYNLALSLPPPSANGAAQLSLGRQAQEKSRAQRVPLRSLTRSKSSCVASHEACACPPPTRRGEWRASSRSFPCLSASLLPCLESHVSSSLTI